MRFFARGKHEFLCDGISVVRRGLVLLYTSTGIFVVLLEFFGAFSPRGKLPRVTIREVHRLVVRRCHRRAEQICIVNSFFLTWDSRHPHNMTTKRRSHGRRTPVVIRGMIQTGSKEWG